jgi:isoaspartyl peptidase/L-asparaginase-like protein (Ntn-hydrolase superfamily)
MRASQPPAGGPVILSTWDHGIPANAAALDVLKAGGTALDAAERGVMVTEADVTNRSVGLTGYPDRDGIVTLDACIMDGDGRAGSVSFVQGIKHPVALARKVMENTPHVMMVGKGAEQYARELGIEQLPNALPPDVQKAWDDWKRTAKYQPVINIENHDTIGLVLMDASGRMAGACTTSGLAWEIRRSSVPDSTSITKWERPHAPALASMCCALLPHSWPSSACAWVTLHNRLATRRSVASRQSMRM